MRIYRIFIWLTIFLLVFDSFGHLFIAIINPETFFFGEKWGGEKARVYLVANAFVALSVSVLIKKNYQLGINLAILYFIYNAYEIYVSYQTITPLTIFSLIVPVMALIYFKLKI